MKMLIGNINVLAKCVMPQCSQICLSDVSADHCCLTELCTLEGAILCELNDIGFCAWKVQKGSVHGQSTLLGGPLSPKGNSDTQPEINPQYRREKKREIMITTTIKKKGDGDDRDD